MDLGLSGRRAAVAASSRGLGFACAAALVAEGARVAICGRSEDGVRAATDRLGAGAVPLVADVASAAVPGMQAQGFGRVVAITSISVRQPIPNLILSNTARAGVTGFLKTLAREVAGNGMTVNSVQPGSHSTARLLAVYGDVPEQVTRIPARRFGRPEDFGRVVAFFCSDHAAFITGAAIPVDGGEYAGLL